MNTLQINLILNCSKTVPNIKEKINELLNKKNEQWIFDSNMCLNFLSLASIIKHEPDLIDGEALAKILKTMTQIESQVGGPYFSSIDNQNQKIDLDTNVIIGYFLSLQNVDLDNINKLIDDAINNNSFESDIFESKFFNIYFISKFYEGNNKQKLINYLLETKPQNQTDNLLILSSLHNLNIDKNHLHSKLKHLTISSDDELNDLLYNNLKENLNKKNSQEKLFYTEEESKMMNLILHTAEKKFKNISEEMKNLATEKIKKTIKGNDDKQMSLMPLFMKQALGEKASKISDDLMAQIGLANVFYWTAFIIYDDFWDEDESADPQILPSANFYARWYISFFTSILPKETKFNDFFQELMDKLDNANTWETIYCRTKVENNQFIIPEKLPEYNNYEHKYEPSSGHVLGPVAMLVYLGYDLESSEVKNLIEYFKNYLIGMQLNDDAHDWEEDMERGCLSTVVTMLIEEWQNEYPDTKIIDLKKDKEKLQKIFWFKTIKKACEKAIDHTTKSREALESIKILENTKPLERFITITENVAKKALKEQKNSVDFLKNYTN